MKLLTQEALYEYLSSELRVDTSAIDPETSLFVSGLVDSFSMVELITFIENTCGIKLAPKEITLDNLDSVKSILSLLASRSGGAPGA